MTTEPRPLQITPRLELRTTAARLTARASHAAALAALTDDAALGHHGQRSTVLRTLGGTFHGFYQPGIARWLRVTVAVAFRGLSWSGDGVTVALSITDGTNTVLASDARMPEVLGGTATLYPGGTSPTRMQSLRTYAALVDVTQLASTLEVTSVWRLTWVVTVGATTVCEGITAEELPRLVIDDAAPAGVLTNLALPLAPILAGPASFRRLQQSLAWAAGHVLHTYHALTPGEADPHLTTSTSWAPFGGDADDAAARRWTLRAWRARGSSAAARWRVRYRLTGLSAGQKGYIRLKSGVGTYTLTLTDVSGAWVDSDLATAALDASATTDTLTFEGKVDAGTLEVSARTVWGAAI